MDSSPPTNPIERLKQHFGFTQRKSLVEFEVIAAAKQKGFQGQGSLEEVFNKAVKFLMNEIK